MMSYSTQKGLLLWRLYSKKENESMAHHKWMAGLNNVSNLTGRLGDLERTVCFLQDMLKESGS